VANGTADSETFVDHGTLSSGLPVKGQRFYRVMLKIDEQQFSLWHQWAL
jgi:hypothetical protein